MYPILSVMKGLSVERETSRLVTESTSGMDSGVNAMPEHPTDAPSLGHSELKPPAGRSRILQLRRRRLQGSQAQRVDLSGHADANPQVISEYSSGSPPSRVMRLHPKR